MEGTQREVAGRIHNHKGRERGGTHDCLCRDNSRETERPAQYHLLHCKALLQVLLVLSGLLLAWWRMPQDLRYLEGNGDTRMVRYHS